jgi:hypothetical protein
MRISLPSLSLALVLLSLSSSTFAQDGTADPEAGDVATEQTSSATAGDATVSTSADANSGAPKKPISVGLLLGYGISLEDGPNPWGFGFGLRGGYNIDAIYLGARFTYYLGEDPVNIWELGIEGGYDFAVSDKFIVRPGLGLGIASLTVSLPDNIFGGGSASESKFYIAPGVSGLYDVTDSVFVGVDARLKLVLSDPMIKAITLLANVGMRF